ncbi:9641_t:CDS:2 [Acaulospora morrowiae]|uniref:Protein N-terminal and lysine N-methyltransferase EFM7 n=1 Tax=Acaulospora morrowiae TaxID=94023 RepID=A0A9N8WJ34_9GLOM|nr:9641_t:CDS:2 [Acaulospora morrowiae]
MSCEDDCLQLEDQDLLLFKEPEGYRQPPPEPKFQSFQCKEHTSSDSPRTLNIRLVGKHPLWAHELWNASKCLAWYLEGHNELIQDKNILELGAGGALPSFISSLNGAKKVVITDYPDIELIENIKYNVSTNLSSESEKIVVLGYIWGKDTTPLLDAITLSPADKPRFDIIIMADLIFNHSEHSSLLRVCKECLESENGQALVFFTHHKPHLADRDMKFFELAQKDFMFKVEKISEEIMKPMFEKDYGSELVRSTVYGYKLTHQK